jgi:hypothetical protein
MPKFTFICEHDDGTKNTHECDEVFLPNVLENFEAFLRGATFNFKGNLDFFDDSDTLLDEDYDGMEEYNTSGYQAFDSMVNSLMSANHTDTIEQPTTGKCAVCGLSESVMKIHKCWDAKCPIQSNRNHAY